MFSDKSIRSFSARPQGAATSVFTGALDAARVPFRIGDRPGLVVVEAKDLAKATEAAEANGWRLNRTAREGY